MSSYQIEFKKSAKKDFKRLSATIQDKILEALELLSLNPYTDLLGVKKLKGADRLYRLRFGDYRLVYEVQSDRLVVMVIKVGHRREIYR